MPRATDYVKAIASIESLTASEERLSVRPFLEYVASVQDVRLSYV